MTRGYYEMPSDHIYIRPESWDKPFEAPEHVCSSYDNCHVPWGSTHEKTWHLVKTLPHVSGLFVWTGFDYLGELPPIGGPAGAASSVSWIWRVSRRMYIICIKASGRMNPYCTFSRIGTGRKANRWISGPIITMPMR